MHWHVTLAVIPNFRPGTKTLWSAYGCSRSLAIRFAYSLWPLKKRPNYFPIKHLFVIAIIMEIGKLLLFFCYSIWMEHSVAFSKTLNKQLNTVRLMAQSFWIRKSESQIARIVMYLALYGLLIRRNRQILISFGNDFNLLRKCVLLVSTILVE